jgi:hypothetical protein
MDRQLIRASPCIYSHSCLLKPTRRDRAYCKQQLILSNGLIHINQDYEGYGEKATKGAFGADRKVISKWRKRLNSRNMKDFYQRFKRVYPLSVKSWQTDNGSENLGGFDEQLKREGIPLYFSYPRCPKINTYIERYNRNPSRGIH